MLTEMSDDDRIKMWLLCLSSAYRVGIRLVLFDEVDRRAQWNDYTTDMTGWTKEQILSALLSLANDGCVSFWKASHGLGAQLAAVPGEEVESLSYSELMSQRGPRVIYGLTRDGGRFWEEYFKPDWSRYNTDRLSASKILLVCASEAMRCEMLGAFLDYYPEYDKQFGLRDIRTGVRNRWQATYWKELEIGFFASARFRERDYSMEDYSVEAPMLLSQYLKDLFRSWESSHISLIPGRE